MNEMRDYGGNKQQRYEKYMLDSIDKIALQKCI